MFSTRAECQMLQVDSRLGCKHMYFPCGLSLFELVVEQNRNVISLKERGGSENVFPRTLPACPEPPVLVQVEENRLLPRVRNRKPVFRFSCSF